MSAAKRDIKNLKEFVDFGFAVQKAGFSIFEGGKFHAEKLGDLFAIVPTVQPAFAELDQIPAEVADLDEAEVAELTQHVLAKGVLPAKASVVLAKSLKVGFAAWDLIREFKSE